MASDRRGFALIEVLVALAILAVAGLGTVRLAAGTLESLHHAHATERRMLDQERLLAAHTLLSRRDLERRTGRRVVGPHLVTIRRSELDLFAVSIADSTGVEDLRTVLYRPEAGDE